MSKIESSREIVARAISEYKPYAIVLMLSGGDDSMTALHVAKEIGVNIDFIMHGVTGTGIEETHKFVLDVVRKQDAKYLEANAGSVYTDYVLRKGFFGVGLDAHSFTYHLLKWTHFRRTVSQNIRHKKRNRNILFINGARRLESENRKITMINPIKTVGGKSNVWVNVINEWNNHDTVDYLESNGIERNPVSKVLCRSGECMCGSMQSMGDGIEAASMFPEWGKWWRELRQAVRDKGFTWDWSEPMTKGLVMEMKGQTNLFQPMCSGCKLNFEKFQEVKHG
jgi:3'-phosphoadenosine 5'-phosphosulfate sulfotransferase (PAPS reductase)/FAD synthetase